MGANNSRCSDGGWASNGSPASLVLRVRQFLATWRELAPTTVVAQGVGADRASTYNALTQLYTEREVLRRTDARGRVWWGARRDLRLTRKERILCALERSKTGVLSTSQLCRAWGERDVRRGYQVLDYYRSSGLLETMTGDVGAEASWRIRP